MRACPPCQRTYPHDTDFRPRDGALSPASPSGNKVDAGPFWLHPGLILTAVIADRRYNGHAEDLPL
jgi:hypothetical protein